MSGSADQRLVARVQGRVQGVGYRYFARSEATRLQLRGWVRNEADGSVCVVAEGPKPDLETLVDRLRAGPSSSRVSRVDTTWEPGRGDCARFEVRF